MPPPPRAYLLTYRTYGTWLHGDGRLSTHQHFAHGYRSPPIPGNARWRSDTLDRMHGDPYLLGNEARRVLTERVHDVCDHCGWWLRAVNVRTNHVHVVVSSSAPATEVARKLKAWGTRRLRELGLADAEQRVWSRRSSARNLWTEEDVQAAVRYVVEGQ